ncbi:leucyl aminopeptidase [bacterium]|nr:leucyl aminopeptidase [bacterium]
MAHEYIKTPFINEDVHKADVLVVGVFEDGTLTKQAKAVDEGTKGFLSRALKTAEFKGKKGKFFHAVMPHGWERVIVAGLGSMDKFEPLDAQNLGGDLVAFLNGQRVKEAAVALCGNKLLVSDHDLAAEVAYGAQLRSYRFDKYRTKEPEEKKPTLKKLTIMAADKNEAGRQYERLEAVIEGVFLTRDLVSEPANIVHPDSFPAYCKELAALGVEVEVLGEKEMKKLGMNALLGVGQGSDKESKLIVMQWNGGKKNDAPVAFIGKGVCFDTGGISIKPAANMEEMKWDMAGAGVVTGLMKTLATRKAKVNVVCVAGVVENMPDGNAQRPGDVVTSMSGQTIEVINTDAEGRLVLADALWYTQDRFKPKFMVNLATLTGAIIVALADVHAGLFSNNDVLSTRLTESGIAVGEPLWRLPLGKEYDEKINCDIADVKNVGDGSGAGSITAAQFLQRFVNDVPWAHLDIAGTAWTKKDKSICPKGGTAFGVRLLDHLVEHFYEGK